jgi:chromosomal replication initiation ATPase DnaA
VTLVGHRGKQQGTVEMSAGSLWGLCLEQIGSSASERGRRFLAGIEPISFDGTDLVLELNDPYQQNLVTLYHHTIEDVASRTLSAHVKVTLTSSSDHWALHLDPTATFEGFVASESTHFTYAAAESVVESLGMLYNPLFIFGGTGLGKTHLLPAIAPDLCVTRRSRTSPPKCS